MPAKVNCYDIPYTTLIFLHKKYPQEESQYLLVCPTHLLKAITEQVVSYLLFSGYEPGYFSTTALTNNIVKFDRHHHPYYSQQLVELNPTRKPLFFQVAQRFTLHRFYEGLLVQIQLHNTFYSIIGTPLYFNDFYFDLDNKFKLERFKYDLGELLQQIPYY